MTGAGSWLGARRLIQGSQMLVLKGCGEVTTRQNFL